MKIRYTLSYKEYVRCQFLAARHLMKDAPWLVYGALGLVALVVGQPLYDLYTRYRSHSAVPEELVINALLPVIALVILGPIFSVLFLPIAWLVYRSPLLEINEEGVRFMQRWIKVPTPWRDVNLLEDDGVYICIGSKLTSASGRLLFVMAPKRIFPSKEEADRFFEQAVAYRREALGELAAERIAWPPAPKRE